MVQCPSAGIFVASILVAAAMGGKDEVREL